MKKLIGWISSMIVYFCVATVIAQAVGIGMLWYKGYFAEDRVFAVLAAAHGVDMLALRDRIEAEQKDDQEEGPSYESALDQHLRTSLDLDVREMAIEKGLRDLASLDTAVRIKHERFATIKAKYDAKLVEIANEAKDAALQNLQTTFEAMTPEQAKDQMLRMFRDGATNDVVQLMLNLPTDRQKKILAQFSNDAEAQELYEILKRIRLGEPTVSTIDQARAELRHLNLASVLPES